MNLRKILILSAAALLPACLFAKDEFAGYYAGKLVKESRAYEKSPDLFARVVKTGNGVYKFDLLSGLFARSELLFSAKNLKPADKKIEIDMPAIAYFGAKAKGVITPSEIKARGTNFRGENVEITLKRLDFKSPTLGLAAPANALVLFDGKDTSHWVFAHDASPCSWRVEDGAMTVGKLSKNGKEYEGTIRTKEKFGAFKMHIEFKIPAKGDGNSGIFVGPYEIQIYNSFGRDGRWDDCGAIYRQTPPQVNASIEPEAWQTYDIEYRPAKFENGKCVADPTFTIFHNGRRIHNQSPVYYDTRMNSASGANYVHQNSDWTIGLQDHGNAVSFRNIWVQKL